MHCPLEFGVWTNGTERTAPGLLKDRPKLSKMASGDAVGLFLALVNHRKALPKRRPVALWASGRLSTGFGRMGRCAQAEQKSAEAALHLARRRGLVGRGPGFVSFPSTHVAFDHVATGIQLPISQLDHLSPAFILLNRSHLCSLEQQPLLGKAVEVFNHRTAQIGRTACLQRQAMAVSDCQPQRVLETRLPVGSAGRDSNHCEWTELALR